MTDYRGINTGYDRPGTEDDTLFDAGPIVTSDGDHVWFRPTAVDFALGVVSCDGYEARDIYGALNNRTKESVLSSIISAARLRDGYAVMGIRPIRGEGDDTGRT